MPIHGAGQERAAPPTPATSRACVASGLTKSPFPSPRDPTPPSEACRRCRSRPWLLATPTASMPARDTASTALSCPSIQREYTRCFMGKREGWVVARAPPSHVHNISRTKLTLPLSPTSIPTSQPQPQVSSAITTRASSATTVSPCPSTRSSSQDPVPRPNTKERKRSPSRTQ